MKPKAVFFDRDGIVNTRPVDDYVRTVGEFEFLADFLPLFELVHDKGYLTILISNQQGVGKGLMSDEDLRRITQHMQDELQLRTGSCFDDVYYCTDLANSGSTRRKPEPGMLLEAIEKWNVDASSSWMIGDTITDMMAGKRAGVKTVLVTSGSTSDQEDVAVATLADCTEFLRNQL